MAETEQVQEKRRRSDRWIIWLIFALFVIGVAIRGYSYMPGGPKRASMKTRSLSSDKSGSNFQDVARDGKQLKALPQENSDSGDFDLVKMIAPYLTEGGLSFFLGFCIGYFLRIVAKTVVFVVGGLYVALILLGHYNVVTVDWGAFQSIAQQLLLNTKAQVQGLQGIITAGLPSVGMGCLGIWRGLKKP
jgi:uncharacterized membrane protein (Fun14 family)